jgi:hypothetical protein
MVISKGKVIGASYYIQKALALWTQLKNWNSYVAHRAAKCMTKSGTRRQ